MPTVKWFGSCTIYVYADHNPPHFHIQGPDWVVVFDLRDFTETVRDGKVPKGPLREALKWATANAEAIWVESGRINEHE